jgi:hypothetical protein
MGRTGNGNGRELMDRKMDFDDDDLGGLGVGIGLMCLDWLCLFDIWELMGLEGGMEWVSADGKMGLMLRIWGFEDFISLDYMWIYSCASERPSFNDA